MGLCSSSCQFSFLIDHLIRSTSFLVQGRHSQRWPSLQNLHVYMHSLEMSFYRCKCTHPLTQAHTINCPVYCCSRGNKLRVSLPFDPGTSGNEHTQQIRGFIKQYHTRTCVPTFTPEAPTLIGSPNVVSFPAVLSQFFLFMEGC